MLTIRKAVEDDLLLLYQWANEKSTRALSYNKELISIETHTRWFNSKLNNENYLIYIFQDVNNLVGQVRFEKLTDSSEKNAIISISIGEANRGKGYSVTMLRMATNEFLSFNKDYRILAYIFKENQVSYNSFLKAGYKFLKETEINNIPTYILYAN